MEEKHLAVLNEYSYGGDSHLFSAECRYPLVALPPYLVGQTKRLM